MDLKIVKKKKKKKKKKEQLIDKIYQGILKFCNIGIGKIRGKHPKRPY